MNLFEKAEECWMEVTAGYVEVRFSFQEDPAHALEALKKQRIDFESYYSAAEAAIRAAQSGGGEGQG